MHRFVDAANGAKLNLTKAASFAGISPRAFLNWRDGSQRMRIQNARRIERAIALLKLRDPFRKRRPA